MFKRIVQELNLRSAVLATAVAIGAATAAWGNVATFPDQKDAMIFGNSSNGDTGNSSGIGPGMFAGADGSLNKKRSLMQFDIAGNIPAGAHITDVQLTLILGQVAGSGTGGTGSNIPSRTLSLYDLNQPWSAGTTSGGGLPDPTQTSTNIGGSGQGSASQVGDSSWTFSTVTAPAPSETGVSWTAGGNFNPIPSATQTLLFPYTVTPSGTSITAGSQYSWDSAQMVTDVQNWLDNPSSNNGWILRAVSGINSSSVVIDPETTSQSFLGFWTRDGAAANSNPGMAPMLTVTFSVPEPSAMLLLGVALPLVLGRRRRDVRV